MNFSKRSRKLLTFRWYCTAVLKQPDKEIGEAAKLGINKINISSDIKDALYQKLRVVLANDPKVREPFELYPEALEAMREVARHKIKLFGSDDKVKYYTL